MRHIVQDACSDDGTLDWLIKDPRVEAYVEKDDGMYDAINRGFRRSTGDYFAYLNCDEQYLPGALKAVADRFECLPEVDVVFAGALVIDPSGGLVCHRKPILPMRPHVLVDHLPVLTCSTFIRRSAFAARAELFDPRYRAISDARWVLDLLVRRVKMATLDYITTAFTDTGDNLSLKPIGRQERAAMRAAAPWWARRLRGLLVVHHRLRKLARGHYSKREITYSIFTRENPTTRTARSVAKPSGVWKRVKPK